MSPTPEEVARVEAELAATSAEVARLPRPALEALAPVLAQAQRETAQGLRSWIERADGESRYTAQSHRAVLAHLDRAIATVASLDPTLAEALRRGGAAAGAMAGQHVSTEIARYAQTFGGEVPRVPLNVARIVATGERSLVPRFRSSAARYAGNVGADIRRELAVGLLRRESVDEMVARLARIGGPRGAVALRGVVGDPGAVVEHISEGLFARYRAWGERLVRTELQQAYNVQVDASLHEAREAIPDLKRRWDASGDLRLCPRCAELHGSVAGLDEPFSGDVMSAPLHPHCRCRVGAWRDAWSSHFQAAAAGRSPAQ